MKRYCESSILIDIRMTNVKYIQEACEAGTLNAWEVSVSFEALMNRAHFISYRRGGMTFLGLVCIIVRDRFIK